MKFRSDQDVLALLGAQLGALGELGTFSYKWWFGASDGEIYSAPAIYTLAQARGELWSVATSAGADFKYGAVRDESTKGVAYALVMTSSGIVEALPWTPVPDYIPDEWRIKIIPSEPGGTCPTGKIPQVDPNTGQTICTDPGACLPGQVLYGTECVPVGTQVTDHSTDPATYCVVQESGACAPYPIELSELRIYGTAPMVVPHLTDDGSSYAGPPKTVTDNEGRPIWAPAVLSLGPRTPNALERELIRTNAAGWTGGDKDIYRFDLGGVHYVAFWYPDNAVTRSMPNPQPWLFDTISIVPWQEGWDQVWNALGDWISSYFCSPILKNVTQAWVSGVSGGKAGPLVDVVAAAMGCGGGCPSGQVRDQNGQCVDVRKSADALTWALVGVGVVAVGGLGFLALHKRRKKGGA